MWCPITHTVAWSSSKCSLSYRTAGTSGLGGYLQHTAVKQTRTIHLISDIRMSGPGFQAPTQVMLTHCIHTTPLILWSMLAKPLLLPSKFIFLLSNFSTFSHKIRKTNIISVLFACICVSPTQNEIRNKICYRLPNVCIFSTVRIKIWK